MAELAERTPQGKIRFSPHPGQWRAWNSQKRFIGVLAGTQSGKTSFGPHWLYREIQRRGPGDYMVVTPTFPLLEKKALPEFKRLFDKWLKLGDYNSQQKAFTFSPAGAQRTFGSHSEDTPTVVWFGYAADPDSLESATAKAVWCDEAGQKKFKLDSWQAILRRLSLAQGRALITTTPYDLGWLKQQVFDRHKRIGTDEEQEGDTDFDIIRFDSTENPLFPQEEFERARRDMPPWKFDLFYRGLFTRPAGQIYDCFLDDYDLRAHPHPDAVSGHKCRPFHIPADWPRFIGLDFGGVNTAALFYAENPATRPHGGRMGSGRLYLYREYLHGGRTGKQHVEQLRKDEPRNLYAAGGAGSEQQWRDEFTAGGLLVHECPIKDVEVGITLVYGAHKADSIIVFDTCAQYLAQKMAYSRVLDPNDEPTEQIEDKSTYHFLDAERYIIGNLRGVPAPDKSKTPAMNVLDLMDSYKR